MSDADNDELHDDTHARFTATLAMSQKTARLAFASFLANCPPPPLIGGDFHRGMLNGKDATIAMAVAGLHAEHKSATLSHLTADDMLALGAIFIGVDQALSRWLGVDERGRLLD